MGFGTSGSLLVVFTGLFVAVGSFYTVAANTAERTADATDRQDARLAEIQQSAIAVTSVTYNESGAGNLTVEVRNTGERALSVGAVDLVVDGRYVPVGDLSVEVGGAGTDLWRPGERLVVAGDAGLASPPARVKVVTGPGVTGTVEVTD